MDGSLMASTVERGYKRKKHDDPLIESAQQAMEALGYDWMRGGIEVLPPAERAVCNAINAPLSALGKLMAEERKLQRDLDELRSEIADGRQELEAIMALVGNAA